jgi:hypothetical protein
LPQQRQQHVFREDFLMLEAGRQCLALLQALLHLRSQTFSAHADKLNGGLTKRKEVGSSSQKKSLSLSSSLSCSRLLQLRSLDVGRVESREDKQNLERSLAPEGLQDSAQGFNPESSPQANRPERARDDCMVEACSYRVRSCALSGRGAVWAGSRG